MEEPPPPLSLLTEEEPFSLEESFTLSSPVLTENQTTSLSHQTEVKKKKKKKKKKRNKKKREGADSTAEDEVANPLSRSFSLPRTHLPGSLLTKMNSKVDSIIGKANQYSSTISDEIDELIDLFDEASKILQNKMNETVRSIKSKRATVSRLKTPDHICNRLCSEMDSLVKKLNLILLDVASYEAMKRGIATSPYLDHLREINLDILEGDDITEPDLDLQVSFDEALAEAKMDAKLMEKLGKLKFGK